MKFFVTGASGFVGTAVVQELLQAGHKVLGLARSDEAAQALAAVGAQVHRGDLHDLASLRQGAAAADGVAHLAFNHDFSQYQAAAAADQQAIEALGSVLAGSDRPLVVTTPLGGLPQGRPATEQDVPASSLRTSEPTALALAAQGVRAIVVRLAASVHGEGDHAFVPDFIKLAREKGTSAYVGEGLNRWSAVHRLDAARLFRLALEQGQAGARYHGVAEEGIAFRELAASIGQHLHLPVVAKAADEAAAHFGWLARFAAMDLAASSTHTRQQLGWQPTGSDLLSDMARYYFNH